MIRSALCSVVLAGLASTAFPAETVTLPLDQFLQLYKASLRKQLIEEAGVDRQKPVSLVEEAAFSVTVSADRATVQAAISGRHVSGKAAAIPLFDGNAILAKVLAVKGATLHSSANGLALLPQGTGQFQVNVLLLVPAKRERRSRVLALKVPNALRNSMTLSIPEDMRLAEHPGLRDRDGQLLFASTNRIKIRLEPKPAAGVASKPEIASLTSVGFKGGRILLVTSFQPVREFGRTLAIRLPEGARYSGSSLSPEQVTAKGKGELHLEFGNGCQSPFAVSCTMEVPVAGKSLALQLPEVVGNVAREQFLFVDEPDDAEIRLSGPGLKDGVSTSRLPGGLRRLSMANGKCRLLLRGGKLSLTLRTFRALEAPGQVVDSVEFFTAFEENGGALSVLRTAIPAGAEPRLHIEAIPGARVWSLKVNGRKKAVYGNGKQGWIVPLERGKASVVEVAFLRRGDKLKLRGTLEAILPATGLSARRLLFAVALPERVQLVSAEGAISPAKQTSVALPPEFTGKRYYFARSFHKGEQLRAKLYYREPAKDERED